MRQPRERFVFFAACTALVVNVAGVSPAQAAASFSPVLNVLGSEGGFFNQVELSADASVEGHLFRIPGESGNPERLRVALRQNNDWSNHDITPEDLGSDRGSLGMSQDGHTMAVAYLRSDGAFVKLSTDAGVTWTDEKVLASGSSGRAWGVHTTVSASGQRIVLSWYERVASKDTAHFIHSGDGGASWSEVIRPSNSGQVEQDVKSAVSHDGNTIALTWKSNGNSTWGYHSFDGGLTWSLKNLTEVVDAQVGGGSTDSNMPDVAVSGNGDAISHVWSANSWSAIHAATTLDQGLSWLGTAITSGITNAAWPQLEMDFDASHRAIAWADYTPGEAELILRLSHTSNSGAAWTDSTMSQGGTLFSAPDIAMSTHGDATAITWAELGSGVFEAWSRFSVNSGLDWVTKNLSEGSGSDARYPSVAVSADATLKAYSWIHDSGGSEHRVKTVTATTGLTPVTPVGAALSPTFESPSSTADGFTVQVSNYNADYTWTVTTTAGSATISNSGLVTVTGLTSGQSATVTVTAMRTGYDNGTAQVNGSAIADPVSEPALPVTTLPTFALLLLSLLLGLFGFRRLAH